MDKYYWGKELPEPYAPSHKDVEIYVQNLKSGSTLLLGCTHKLIPYSDFQMDIDPWYEAPTVIVDDWRNNKSFYTNIMGDGVFNFTEELTNDVLHMASKCSDILAIRCFNKKLPNMKVASYFPKQEDFSIKVNYSYSFKDYNFFIWKFNV